MSKIPVYVCNRKKCLNCVGALCGRTIDKDYAALNENGHPKIDSYIPFEGPERTWQSFKEMTGMNWNWMDIYDET